MAQVSEQIVNTRLAFVGDVAGASPLLPHHAMAVSGKRHRAHRTFRRNESPTFHNLNNVQELLETQEDHHCIRMFRSLVRGVAVPRRVARPHRTTPFAVYRYGLAHTHERHPSQHTDYSLDHMVTHDVAVPTLRCVRKRGNLFGGSPNPDAEEESKHPAALHDRRIATWQGL